jgi:signal transduction histidine kinase
MKQPHILIVKSQAAVASELAARVKGLGYEVIGIAADGKEALSLTDGLAPDLVLMDIDLNDPPGGAPPGKAMQGLDNVPVVYLSDHPPVATLDRLNITGPFGYICNPFDERDVQMQIAFALFKHRSEEKLRQADEALEQFTYAASHDLQAPLRSVIGFLQLLQTRCDDRLDEEGRHFIQRCVSAGYRMQAMIEGLLTLSRVNTHASRFALTDLNRILQNVLKALPPILLERNPDMICAVLPNLSVDGGQIHSLFQHLITNALTYNNSRVPRVEIGCQEQADAFGFYVKDNGIGIRSQFHQRIFTVFQRLHTDREYSGIGLGLALCKRIVERHGGSLWVESPPEKGSTFHFSLPKQTRTQDI